jgi:hypothetical protein
VRRHFFVPEQNLQLCPFRHSGEICHHWEEHAQHQTITSQANEDYFLLLLNLAIRIDNVGDSDNVNVVVG